MISESYVLNELKKLHNDYKLSGKRVLVIIPDHTRTAPIGMFFRLLNEVCGKTVAQLDFLIALGTHPLMSEEEILKLVGITLEEKDTVYSGINVFNHEWNKPETFKKLGDIEQKETEMLTGGILSESSEIWINRMVWDYDQLFVIGPVFPHELAGFSGYSKYLFPGICGPEFIATTHWIGALNTNLKNIRIRETPLRKLIDHAAGMMPVPILWLNLVVNEQGLHGLFIGEDRSAWEQAVELSSQINIRYVNKPFKQVLSCPSKKYDDLWTGGKAFYKIEPAVEDGGELIIYAPHIKQISITHDEAMHKIGYHIKDYFLAHMDEYRDISKTVMTYSTMVKGSGVYREERETPRVNVILATGIPREICERLNIDYIDPEEINIEEWENREGEGTVVIRNAGETLFRLK